MKHIMPDEKRAYLRGVPRTNPRSTTGELSTMFTVPEQHSQAQDSMSERLGPHFFSRTSKEEGRTSESDTSDHASNARYIIELTATGLGTYKASSELC